MKNNNEYQQLKNIILFVGVVMLLSMTSIVVVSTGKAHAVTSSPVVPSNNNSTTSSLGISSTPFYEAKIGKIIGQKVVNTGNGINPQIEISSIENGTINGVGNVTNIQTWTDTFKSPRISYGVGQGVIVTQDDQDMATWIGYGSGRSNINGTTYHDILFFNTNSTGKLAFLKNLEGLHVSEIHGNDLITKIYEWK